MAQQVKEVKLSEVISDISSRFSEFSEDVRASLREAWESIINQVVSSANELLDRITGKETSTVLNLDNVVLDLGADRKLTTTGTIKLTATIFK